MNSSEAVDHGNEEDEKKAIATQQRELADLRTELESRCDARGTR